MDDEIKQLLLQNLKRTQAVEETVKKIKRYIVWQQIFNVVKVVVIVVPLVIGILYAVPLFKQAFSAYQGVISSVNSIQGKSGSNNLLEVINGLNGGGKISEEQIKKFLK